MQIPITEDIYLRTFATEDAPNILGALRENRAHLRQWIFWIDQIQTIRDATNMIKENSIQLNRQKALVMGIFENGQLLGSIEMQDWDHELKKANIGYWLVKEREGKGLMTQAAQVFLAYLFGQLQLNKIELMHLPGNYRSAALAKRLGFKIEGLLRDAILVNGSLQNIVLQGLLRREFGLPLSESSI